MTMHGLDPDDPYLRAMNDMTELMLRDYVETGVIEIGDKLLQDIFSEFATLAEESSNDWAMRVARGEAAFLVEIDHRPKLLEYAAREADAGNYETAVTFYGLWIEHTVNGCLIRGLQRKGYGQEIVKPLLRELSTRTKITALWQIVGFPPLSDEDTRIADQIAQARNSFVHYKYPGYDDATRAIVNNQLKTVVERSQDLITAFGAAMNAFFWDGREEEIISFVREKSQTEIGWLGKYRRQQDQSAADG